MDTFQLLDSPATAPSLSPRVQALRDRLFAQPRQLSFERARLYTESWRDTEGKPAVLRRALALARILRHVAIQILPEELIVGDRTLRPRSGIPSPEMSPGWIGDELDTMADRPQDPFEVREEDKRLFREGLAPYWTGRALGDRVKDRIPESVSTLRAARIVKLNQTDKGQGHIIPCFDDVLTHGLGRLLERVRQRCSLDTDTPFLKAAEIALTACSDYIDRYAALARDQGHVDVAGICTHIANQPPRTFREGLQLFWFINLALQFESNASSISPGRLDQYMLPLYRRDTEAGRLTSDEAAELLRCLWIKFNDVVLLRSAESARYFGGFPTGYTVVVGGLNAKGHDASNALSRLCLQTYADIRLPQPNLAVRLHSGTPEDFLQLTAAVMRLGTGLPQLFNDEVIVDGFLRHGVTLEHARDYAVVGCVELSIPGRTYGLHDIAMLNLARGLETTLTDGLPATFDDLTGTFRERITHWVAAMAFGANIVDRAHAQLAPTPLLSCFIDDCVGRGRDVSDGGARYNFSGVQAVGVANVADALCAVRELVYQREEIAVADLLAALRCDYSDHETMRQRLLNAVPKYGNDNDDVDALARDILEHYCRDVEGCANTRGGAFHPGAYTVSAHIPMGASVGATPDGRRGGEQLADGGLSPMTGRDRRGPTAVLQSVSKLENVLLANGSLLNLKFHPSSLAGAAGLDRLTQFLRTFCRLQIQHLQLNVVDADTLRDAQKHPGRYGSLVVRVAGYSALFVDLGRAIQDDIINRTEHRL